MHFESRLVHATKLLATAKRKIRKMPPKKQGESSKPFTEEEKKAHKKAAKKAKKKAKKAAAKSASKSVPKREEKKMEAAVEKKVSRREARPKAGNVGYLGVYDGTKQRSERKNNVVVQKVGFDEATVTYEGDWQGETCLTNSSGQNIFSGTADIVLINPKSLGASIENEARNWREYLIEYLELWIEPLQGVTNTPGNICTGVETDPAYFAASGATLDFDTVNSYRPHVDHPVYCQDKPRKLIYDVKRQKTQASGEMFYCYYDSTQYATNAAFNAATGTVDANVRQCFQLALISYCKACTASTELGVWQMKVRIRFRGNKKSQALPGFMEAEVMADTIINSNNKNHVEQKAEYIRRVNEGERLSPPVYFPNPRQVDSYRILIDGLVKQYNFTRNLAVARKIQLFAEWVKCYDTIKANLVRNALQLSRSLAPKELKATADVPVSALPVVIVDPSVASDARVASLASAAKVSSAGTLQTSGGGGGVISAKLVDGSGNALRTDTFIDGVSGTSQSFLASVPHSVFWTSGNPGSGVHRAFPNPAAFANLPAANGASIQAAVPVNGAYDMTGGAGSSSLGLGAPFGGAAITDSNGTNSVSYTTQFATVTNGGVEVVNGNTPIIQSNVMIRDSTSGRVTSEAVNAVQYITNGTTGSAEVHPVGAVSYSILDQKGNSNTVYAAPLVGYPANGYNTQGNNVAVSTNTANVSANIVAVNSVAVPISSGCLPVTLRSILGGSGTQGYSVVSSAGSLQTILGTAASSSDDVVGVIDNKDSRPKRSSSQPPSGRFERVNVFKCSKCSREMAITSKDAFIECPEKDCRASKANMRNMTSDK